MATKKKPGSGVKVTIIKAGAYYQGNDPVKTGATVTVPKAEAAKLVARGIAEEN